MSDSVQQTVKYLLNEYYNPSSLYQQSKDLSTVMYTARSYLATIFGTDTNKIFYTSGGTESNNWAIRSLAKKAREEGKTHVISTAIEHPSILLPLCELEASGFKVSLILPDENGLISPDKIESEITEDTAFVSVMYANNEIGTLQPIKEIGKICHDRKVLFHTDAVQAVGHIPIDITKQNIDLLSFSSHKFGGMKGCGGLVCGKDVTIEPMILGGGQEFGMRAGTENAIGILSTTQALKDAYTNLYSNAANDYIVQRKIVSFLETIPDTKINADLHLEKLSNNISVSFKGISGQSLALMMAGDGILVSTMSACSVGSGKHSHVLKAIGVTDDYIDGTIRITFGHNLSQNDIQRICNSIKNNVEKLRSVKR